MLEDVGLSLLNRSATVYKPPKQQDKPPRCSATSLYIPSDVEGAIVKSSSMFVKSHDLLPYFCVVLS